MRLSAPIYRLKRQAKLLSRAAGMPLNEALDRVARDEGFQSWSLLVARRSDEGPAATVFARLRPGDMILLGARPGQGKTLMALQLLAEAIKVGHRGIFYTLEYTAADVTELLRSIGASAESVRNDLTIVTSDAISADYIMEDLRAARRGTVAVIDYLQLLDQRREKPAVGLQVAALKSFAVSAGLIFVVISQIDRSYDPSTKALPDLADIRLPNPVDLSLFTKTCFLGGGELRFEVAAAPNSA